MYNTVRIKRSQLVYQIHFTYNYVKKRQRVCAQPYSNKTVQIPLKQVNLFVRKNFLRQKVIFLVMAPHPGREGFVSTPRLTGHRSQGGFKLTARPLNATTDHVRRKSKTLKAMLPGRSTESVGHRLHNYLKKSE